MRDELTIEATQLTFVKHLVDSGRLHDSLTSAPRALVGTIGEFPAAATNSCAAATAWD